MSLTDTAARFDLPTMMTTAEVAEVCHVRAETVQAWAKAGAPLRGVKLPNGDWRFDRDDVAVLLRYVG